MTIFRHWRMAMIFTFFLFVNASSFVAIRVAIVEFSPTHLALLRFLVASGVLALCAPLCKIRFPQKRDWLALSLTGFSGVFVYQTLLNWGQQTVTAGSAAFLTSTAPVFTVILAVLFLGENLNARQKLGIGVSFGGAIVIALGEQGGVSFSGGAILILIAAVASAVYIVLQKHLLARYSPFELTAYAFWLGTFMLLMFSSGLPSAIQNASVRANAAAIYLGIFPGALGNVIWALLVNKTTASAAASWLYAVPLVSILIAWPVLREAPSTPALVGGALALLGVAIMNVKTSNRKGAPRVLPTEK